MQKRCSGKLICTFEFQNMAPILLTATSLLIFDKKFLLINIYFNLHHFVLKRCGVMSLIAYSSFVLWARPSVLFTNNMYACSLYKQHVFSNEVNNLKRYCC